MKPNYRCCISCRAIAPKAHLWRVVRVYPDHTVQLDQGMGRSAYLCPTADCLHVAQKRKRLERTLRTTVPATIYDQLKQRLVTSIVETVP